MILGRTGEARAIDQRLPLALSQWQTDRSSVEPDALDLELDGVGHGPSPGLSRLQPDILLCPMDDSSVGDSEQASAASTVPLLQLELVTSTVTLLSLPKSPRGLRPDLPRDRSKKESPGL